MPILLESAVPGIGPDIKLLAMENRGWCDLPHEKSFRGHYWLGDQLAGTCLCKKHAIEVQARLNRLKDS